MTTRKNLCDKVLGGDDLAQLTSRLDDQALAAAMRLIDVQFRSGGAGVPTCDDLRAFLRMRRDTFRRIEPQLAEVFNTESGYWRHPGVDARIQIQQERRERERRRKRDKETTTSQQESESTSASANATPASGTCETSTRVSPHANAAEEPDHGGRVVSNDDKASTAVNEAVDIPDSKTDPSNITPAHTDENRSGPAPPRRKRGSQGSLLPALHDRHVSATNSADTRAPQAPAPGSTTKQGDQATAVLQAAYEAGEHVLVKGGQRPEQARRCIAMLLKEYETQDVIDVINMMLDREGEIAHPLSYMRKVLSQRCLKRVDHESIAPAATGSPRHRPPSGRRNAGSGISDEMADRIRRNASPSVNYDFVEPEEENA